MKFYYFNYACSTATHVALEELGIPFTPVALDLRGGEHLQPTYQAISALQTVPALALDSGEVLTENTAILHWLAETHPGAALWPTSPLERARALEWMSMLAADFHSAARLIWRTDRFIAREDAQADLKQGQLSRYPGLLAVAEARFRGPWVLGEQYTVVDAHLLPYYRWARMWKLDLAAFPKLQAWHVRMLERPAVVRALTREGQRL